MLNKISLAFLAVGIGVFTVEFIQYKRHEKELHEIQMQTIHWQEVFAKYSEWQSSIYEDQ